MTATASAGMFEVRVPTPAMVTSVMLPTAFLAAPRVSMTRFGLNGLPRPSELSTRTALILFQRVWLVPDPAKREAQIELSLPRTNSCSKVGLPPSEVTAKAGAMFGADAPTSSRPTMPRRPDPTAPPDTGKLSSSTRHPMTCARLSILSLFTSDCAWGARVTTWHRPRSPRRPRRPLPRQPRHSHRRRPQARSTSPTAHWLSPPAGPNRHLRAEQLGERS